MNFLQMNPEIECERLIQKLYAKGISDERVIEAFRGTRRHLFVSDTRAYEDVAIPISADGQTISQPSVVALMTQLLELDGDFKRGSDGSIKTDGAGRKLFEPGDQKILEIGTGSGFQTAILAYFTRRVFTIERNRELGEKARLRLREMGYANITFRLGDGSCGWVQWSPFDRIIVTAGAPVTPETLAEQLAVGGIMIIPTGGQNEQELMVYKKTESGLESTSAGKVLFVPLVGQFGWQ